MKRSTWLIQRLQKPNPSSSSPLAALVNSLAFGGGKKNGGLTKEAMALLEPIFSFDYMGSSEFEWGAVRRAIAEIVKNRANYVYFPMEIAAADIKPNWRRSQSLNLRDANKTNKTNKTKKQKAVPALVGPKTIWVYCDMVDRSEVEELIRKLAKDEVRLKEGAGLATALDPVEEWDARTLGWLELDNGFFFFIDETMAKATHALFHEGQ